MNSELGQFRVNGYLPPEHVITFPRDGRCLAFDQAMRFTGWALLDVKDGQAELLDAGCLTTTAGEQSGWKSSYASQTAMGEQIMTTLVQQGERATMIAYELPPTGKLARPDASIMAGMSVCNFAHFLYPDLPLLLIGKQRAANQLTGNPKAKKEHIAATLCVATWIKGIHLIQAHPKYRAEHEYDALGVAITAITKGE
jgi:Holliday junction resolvasome RuvABC endonuclease subunit